MLADLTIGGTVTLVLAVIGGLWKIRKEARELTAQRERDRVELEEAKRRAEVEARSAAVEAAESAVGVVKSAMETQGAEVTDLRTRVTNQETQITTLGSRVEDVTKRHGVAVSHIAEREDAADEHLGPDRPAWLPPIPDLIRPDVDAARRPQRPVD